MIPHQPLFSIAPKPFYAIDRIEVQRILGYIVEAEEKKKAKVQEKRDEEGVKVELSKELKNSLKVDYEDLE